MREIIGVIIGLIVISGYSWAVTPVRITDGRVEFAIASVNSIACWTKEEQDLAIQRSTVPAVVEGYTPTAEELDLAKGGLRFDSFSDYDSCLKDIEYLKKRLGDLPPSESKEAKDLIDTVNKVP